MEVDLTKPWDMSDITFVVEDELIYVNKTILSMSSEVFKKMFTADFREKELAEISLPGKSFESFLQFMKLLHPPYKELEDTKIIEMLPLAHEYGALHILHSCEKHLLAQPPSVKHMVLAELYGLDHLRQACSDYMRKTPISQLEQENGFQEVDPGTMVAILTYKVKRIGDAADYQKVVYPTDVSKEFLHEITSMPYTLKSLLLVEEYDIAPLRAACILHIVNQSPEEFLQGLTELGGVHKIPPRLLELLLQERAKLMCQRLNKLGKFERVQLKIKPILQKIDSLLNNGRLSQRVCRNTAGDQVHVEGVHIWRSSGYKTHCTYCEAAIGRDIKEMCVPLLRCLDAMK